jgi:hypothetical protein
MKWMWVVVFYVFSSINVLATNYYVSTSGNDSNPGTIDKPWRTIQKGANTAVAGDVVNIKPGTYNERIKPANSGSVDKPIVFQKYGSDEVVLSSSDWSIVNIDNKNWIVIDGFTIKGKGSQTVGVSVYNGNHNIIRNNNVGNVRLGIGVHAGNSDSLERNVTSIGNLISNNVIHDVFFDNLEGEAIYIKNYMPDGETDSYTKDTIIENNTVYNAIEAIQNTGGTWTAAGKVEYLDRSVAPKGTIVRGNRLYNNTCDQGTVTLKGEDIVVENNFLFNNDGSGPRSGLSLRGGKFIVKNNVVANTGGSDAGRSAINLNDVVGEVSGNTIVGSDGDGIVVNYSKSPNSSLTVKNNIIFGVANRQVVRSGDTSKVNFDRNLFGKSETFLGLNYKIVSDMKFIDPVNGDFHLQPNSPACGLGAYPCGTTPTASQSGGQAGDINNDGSVDLSDFSLWKEKYLKGEATLVDFGIWKKGYLGN